LVLAAEVPREEVGFSYAIDVPTANPATTFEETP
jgi:hypothetical protein